MLQSSCLAAAAGYRKIRRWRFVSDVKNGLLLVYDV